VSNFVDITGKYFKDDFIDFVVKVSQGEKNALDFSVRAFDQVKHTKIFFETLVVRVNNKYQSDFFTGSMTSICFLIGPLTLYSPWCWIAETFAKASLRTLVVLMRCSSKGVAGKERLKKEISNRRVTESGFIIETLVDGSRLIFFFFVTAKETHRGMMRI